MIYNASTGTPGTTTWSATASTPASATVAAAIAGAPSAVVFTTDPDGVPAGMPRTAVEPLAAPHLVLQTAPATVLAVGLVFVLAAGEIDLSFGAAVEDPANTFTYTSTALTVTPSSL